MIAVIIEHAHNPHYTFLIDDIVAELRTHGYIPLLLFTHSSEETEQQMLKLALYPLGRRHHSFCSRNRRAFR